MRTLAWILLVGLLIGCSKPAPPPEAPKVEAPPKEFTLNDFELRAPFQGVTEVQVQRAFEVESLKAHLETTVTLVEVSSARVVVDLRDATEGKVTVRAGAVDLAGYRLARDWTVTLRKPDLPPLALQKVPGGFQVGPYQGLNFQWLDAGRIEVRGSRPDVAATTIVRTSGDFSRAPFRGVFLTETTVGDQRVTYSGDQEGIWRQSAGGEPVKVAAMQPTYHWADTWHNHIQPGGTGAVLFTGKVGPRMFTDLTTGKQHDMGGPRFYGSNVFDAWAPDGSLFLVQSLRTDPVPGFYFHDGKGQLHQTWHEPGYFSNWAEWSPDSRSVSFLSIPIDRKYKAGGEQWDELPFAPRLGVLDIASGKARYYSLEGLDFYGRGKWSPDGTKIAAGCGELQASGNGTMPKNARTCLIDLQADTVRQLTQPSPEYTFVTAERWAPGGSGFLAYAATENAGAKLAVSLKTGTAVAVHETALWAGPDATLVVLYNGDKTSTLHRAGADGQLREALFTGPNIWGVTLSPDGAHMAFTIRNEAPGDVGTYLVVLKLNP